MVAGDWTMVSPPAAMGPVAETPASKYLAPVPVKEMGPETGARKTAAELVETRISAPATPVTGEWKVAVAPPVTTTLPVAALASEPKMSLTPAERRTWPELARPPVA